MSKQLTDYFRRRLVVLRAVVLRLVVLRLVVLRLVVLRFVVLRLVVLRAAGLRLAAVFRFLAAIYVLYMKIYNYSTFYYIYDFFDLTTDFIARLAP